MNKKNYIFLQLLLLLCCLGAAPGISRAQILQVGDIAFTGYNSNDGAGGNPNQVSFVILRSGGIVSGTQLHLTDNGYNNEASALLTTEGDVLINFGTNLPQFTEVYVKVSSAGTSIDACTYKNSSGVFVSTNISASVTGFFILSQAGDQVLAFQGSLASPTFISGIHMNSEVAGAAGQPATSAANWDATANANGALGWVMTQSRSTIPPGLVNGTNAIIAIPTPGALNIEKDNATFNCSASVGSSAADLRQKINNVANWSQQDGTPYTVPTNCTYMISAPPAVTGQPTPVTTCAGSNASFQVTATNATGYQWQVSVSGGSYTDLSNTSPYSGVATATLAITGVTAGMSGNSYRCVVSGNVTPNATSNGASLTVSSPGTWTGAVSTAWSNTANWSCGVLPTATTDVTISGSAAHMPMVDIATAICNNFTLNSGATFSFSGSANVLEVKGTIVNAGSFDASAGKLILSGAAQNVPTTTFKDLQLNGSGSKTMLGSISVSGVLTLTNGVLVLGNNNVTITASGSISGGSASSFLVTNGTGTLRQNNIGTGGRTGTIVFPVGSSTTSFTRAALSNTGTADNFSVKVIQGIFDSYTGTTGSGAITMDYVNKTWFITEGTAGGSNVNLTLEWNGIDELGGFTNANCQIAHYGGTGWVATGTPGVASGLDPFTISRPGITEFSPFSVSSSAALPLQLLSFTGRKDNSDVVLDWLTASEKNISNYVVERAADGRDFRAVATLASQVGNGNEALAYTWTDASILAKGESWYYRLRIVHEDGSVLYSPVVWIQEAGKEQPYILYPNPLRGAMLNVRGSKGKDGQVVLSITDMLGRVYLRQTAVLNGNAPLQLNTEQLAPGLYALRVGNPATGAVTVLRFTKP